MTTRRHFLITGAAVALMGAAPRIPTLPDGNRIAFRIVRKGDAIGMHTLDFTPVDNGFDVRIAVDIAVSFGPIVVFRYALRGLEQWRGGRPVHLEATTNDDGTKFEVRTELTAEGLKVSATNLASYLAPPDALPATHWNMAELDGPWINPEDGKLLHPAVSPATSGEVALADGRRRKADRYHLTGDARLDLWYDPDRRWTALEFIGNDGSQINYELT